MKFRHQARERAARINEVEQATEVFTELNGITLHGAGGERSK
jgi:hypothetical protein